jgi:hypothetical protein
MPSYDVHQHLWPASVVETLRSRRSPPRLAGDVLELEEGRFPVDLAEHGLEQRLALLDRDDTDVAVVSLPPTLCWEDCGELADAFHAGILELVAQADGRLAAFACRACLEGFAGACVSAAEVVRGLDRLPEELESAGQVLFVHPGPPSPPPPGTATWWSAVADYTAQMQAAYLAWLGDGAARHPRLPVVFAVLAGGAPVQAERLASRGLDLAQAALENVYLDTASYGTRALALCLDTYGAGRLVFGSDVPVIDSRTTLRAIAALGEAVEEDVRRSNPTRLFG